MSDDFPKRIAKWAEVQALKDAGRLTQAEVKLIEAAQTGEIAIIGTSVPTTKSDAVLIRAPLIRYLALGGCEDCEVEATGVQVVGAWIDGVIDLRYATAKGRLALVDCHIADRMELLQCTLPGLNLSGSTLPKALNAQGAQFAGDVFLNEVTADGEVWLSSATIGGQLACEGANLNNPNGDALNAQSAQITGDVFLSDATADGEVCLSGATIGGQLAYVGAKLRNADGKALNAQGAKIAGGVVLNEVTTDGEVSLSGATIGGQLSCVGAKLNNPDGDALNAHSTQIAGGVFLRGATVDGEVRLSGATVGGQLSCVGAKLRNAAGDALNAHSTQIAGGVFLRESVADGEMRLSGATIGGQLSCTGAKLRNPDGFSLNTQRATIAESAFLDGAAADGEVSLSGATISGQLSCEGATFQNVAGKALNLQRIVVKDGFYWRDVKAVTGRVDLNSAHVADLADDAASWAKCDAVSLANFAYGTIYSNMTIADRLDWLRKGAVFSSAFHPQPYEQLAKVLNQSGHKTEARAILVEKEKVQRRATRQFWRGERKLGRLLRWYSRKPVQNVNEKWRAIQEDTPAITGTANEMLDRYKLFHDDAKDADVAKYTHAQLSPFTQRLAQKDFRNQQFWRAGWLRCRIGVNWAWDWLLRGVIGYGYKPQRSAYTLALLVVVGWALAAGAWKAGDFAPNSDVILDSTEWQALATDRETYPNPAREWSSKYNEESDILGRGQDYATFNSFYYAIDVVVPIIALGQEAAWAPSTNRGPWGWWLWVFNPILTLLGWLVTAIGAAAVTGVIRKE